MHTVAGLLAAAVRRLGRSGLAADEAQGDAGLLLARALGEERAFVIAHPEARVGRRAARRFAAWVRRRASREPVAYILGEREFFGRVFRVSPVVLVPRPETECVVEAALARLPDASSARVLDLGTGSGCIAITIALERPQARVFALDRSLAALRVARANARRLGARVRFLASDWDAAVAGVGWDLVVSNPPYVGADELGSLAPELAHEPRMALTDGANGLAGPRRALAAAARLLAAGGRAVVECGPRGLPAPPAGLVLEDTVRDLGGHLRAGVYRRR